MQQNKNYIHKKQYVSKQLARNSKDAVFLIKLNKLILFYTYDSK